MSAPEEGSDPATPEDDRPRFARAFPRDPALDALLAAFEAGDFAHVREGAPKLASSTSDPAVRRAALDLRAHVEPDPLARWLLVITGALLVVLSAWWIAHDGPGSAAPNAAPRAAPPAASSGPLLVK